VNPNDEPYQKLAASAVAASASPRLFLFLYLRLASERLKRLSDEWEHFLPVPRGQEDIYEWLRKAQEHIAETEDLMLQRGHALAYLGHKPWIADTRTQEGVDCLIATKWIRAATQRGDSDEEIAAWLRRFLTSSTKGKRGRPAGSWNCDGHTLLALEMHDSARRIWTWPKLADNLPVCANRTDHKGKPHTSDSSCVVTLKKSVEGLRKFLLELGYEQTVT
jgi:hypothetical protein